VQPVTADLLRRQPLFRRMSDDDRARVAAVAHLRDYARSEPIFAEGDNSDVFIVVIEGRVKVSKATPAGKEIILEIFGPGDALGAMAVYESLRFPASAMALEPTTCLRIARKDFFQLLEQHPALVRALLSGLSLRLAELTRRLTELSSGRVEARFARLFLKLADRIGQPERGGVFLPIPLSRQELADLTGTTIETCIRIMSRWQKDAIVRTEKDGFVVLSRDALDEAAAG
jgi:CRP-like cAMP-binding protein